MNACIVILCFHHVRMSEYSTNSAGPRVIWESLRCVCCRQAGWCCKSPDVIRWSCDHMTGFSQVGLT